MSRTVTLIQTAEPMPPLNEVAFERLAQDTNELVLMKAQHESAVRAVALQVGYQLPADCTDPDLIQRDISANMRRSVEACLEVGRGLTVLKASCGHGNFTARLDVLGIEERVAQKFMGTARRFSKPASTPLLNAAGNQTKLFEMLLLDDGQIEEFELTGQSGDLKLDEIATMSVKELRAALKEAREEGKTSKSMLDNKTARIEKLERERERVKKLLPDDVKAEILREVSDLAEKAIGAIQGGVRMGFDALVAHHISHGGDSRQVMAGYVAQLQQMVNELRDDFNLPDTVGDGTPAWQVWADAQDAAKAADSAND